MTLETSIWIIQWIGGNITEHPSDVMGKSVVSCSKMFPSTR